MSENSQDPCCGSGSNMDPDARGPLDPDPDPGGRNDPKKVNTFHFLSAECSLLRSEGFSCSLDIS